MSAVVNHLSFNFVNQLVHIIDIGIILNRSRVIAALAASRPCGKKNLVEVELAHLRGQAVALSRPVESQYRLMHSE